MKLRQRRALIAGMGGLGTKSAELLASIGIGYLRIVDYDVVELSNLPRQSLYTDADINKAKVDVAEEKLKLRNPTIEIDPQATRIDAISAPSLLDGVDIVIDALDSFVSRRVLHRVARSMNVPYVFAGAIAEQANIIVFDHKPNSPCLDCVIGSAEDEESMSCEIRGVHPSILELATSIQVAEAVKVLLKQESTLIGTMLYIDLLDLEFDKITFQKRSDCPTCSLSEEDKLDKGKDGEVTKGIREIEGLGKALVTSLCGRDTRIIDPKWEINWIFEEVCKVIGEKWKIVVAGNNYITFNVQGVGVSLLHSGVATLRGAQSTANAINIYQQVFSHLSA